MHQINFQYYKTCVGELIIASYNGKLCLLDYRYRKVREAIDGKIKDALQAEYKERDDHIIEHTIAQLEEYLSGDRKKFTIPIILLGTEFQTSVWHLLLKLSYGSTSSYRVLAEQLGNRNAVRAVARANGANPLNIIVPCHRVIGSHGKLHGYAGGVAAKKHLLLLEETNSEHAPDKLF